MGEERNFYDFGVPCGAWLNGNEFRRFQFLKESLGMSDEALVGWLIRAALTWFPSTWLGHVNRVNELREPSPILAWHNIDDIPF